MARAPEAVVHIRQHGYRRARLELKLIDIFLPLLGDERSNRWARASFERVSFWAKVDGGEWQRVR